VRSLSLGKAVHAVGDAYYKGGSVRWESLPGAIYVSGVHLLPKPAECELIEVEHAIGATVCKAADSGVAQEAFGVLWVGFRDLLIKPRGGDWLQVDYKTSSKIAAWALKPEELRDDLQCALYTLDACQRFNRPEFASRWLYLETKQVRRALPVDVVMSRAHALSIIEPAALLARELDRLERSSDAPQNHDACAAYGGCSYHVGAGGPCDARRSLMAQYAQYKGTHMALEPDLAKKFLALKAPAEPPPLPLQPPPADALPAAAFSAPAAPAAPAATAATAATAAPAAPTTTFGKFAAAAASFGATAAPAPVAAPAAAPAAPAEPARHTRTRKAKEAATIEVAPPAAQGAVAVLTPTVLADTRSALSERLTWAIADLKDAEDEVELRKAAIAAILAAG
jgi:hypothetical protein